MAKIYKIHPQTPQSRILEQVVHELRQGAIMLYPTDTVYAIGCDMVSKDAIQRVRQMKRMSNDKPLTFLCPSLSNIAHYAVVTDAAYRTMKSLIPGPYTFILPATKLVPKLVLNPKRKTTGIRVPDHLISQALLDTLGNPIISTSANLGQEQANQRQSKSAPPNIYDLSQIELFDYFDKLVDIIIDDGSIDDKSVSQAEVSTILDMTGPTPELVRQGAGDVSFLF